MCLYILGDPGVDSGGGKKSKRARKKFGLRKVKIAVLARARLDFFSPPLTAPESPGMVFIVFFGPSFGKLVLTRALSELSGNFGLIV